MNSPRQTAIPCTLMRGGTSKGPYFLGDDLPRDAATRDRVLLAVMGSPDPRQIDGLGGADPLTSKVAIVSRSERPGVDVDYLFAQVVIDATAGRRRPELRQHARRGRPVRDRARAGARAGPDSRACRSTWSIPAISRSRAVETPGGVVRYDGAAAIAGVPGTAAPIYIDFLDTAGSVCKALLPTRHRARPVEGIDAHLHRQRHAGGRDPRGRPLARAATSRPRNSTPMPAFKARLGARPARRRPR